MTVKTPYNVRQCAQEIIHLISESHGDSLRLSVDLRDPLLRLLERQDLLTLGVKREGNHVDFSRYLYFDGELSITIDRLPKDRLIPPHDHGTWELLAIYRGRLSHTVYERHDDGFRDQWSPRRRHDRFR